MIKAMIRGIAVLLLGAGLLAAGACGGGSSEGPHMGDGVVQQVDVAQRQVTIKHGDIPGLMSAMTMAFEVDDAALLQGLEPGTEVHFGVKYADGRYVVTSIERK
jgi:Cu/Ag efflux protein CusF